MKNLPQFQRVTVSIAELNTINILPALPSSSSGQGGPIRTTGLSHAVICPVALGSHQNLNEENKQTNTQWKYNELVINFVTLMLCVMLTAFGKQSWTGCT